MADSINILVPKEAIDSIIQTDAAITKLDIVYRKMLTTIEQGTKVMKDSAVTEENLNKAKKTQTETTEQLDAASKKLAASEKALNDFDKEKYAQTARNNQALKEQQSEVLKMVQAEKQLTGTIEKAEASTKALTAERKKLDLETIEGTKRLKEINAVIDKNTEVIRTNGDAATKQRMNIGNYKSALEGLPGPLGNIATSAGTAGTALKTLSKVPLLAAILAIGAALFGLFKAFKSTEEGGDKLAIGMGKLSGIFGVLRIAVQEVSLALVDLFKKDPANVKMMTFGMKVIEIFTGMGKKMKDASQSGGELKKVLDEVGEEQMAYGIEQVKLEIQEKRAAAAETSNMTERAKLLKEAIAMTEEMYQKEIGWSKRTADATVKFEADKYGIKVESMQKYLLSSEAGRKEMEKEDVKLANYGRVRDKVEVAAIRGTLTDEINLKREGYRETLRMRKSAFASEESDRKTQAAAFKKRVDDQRKAFEDNAKLESEAITQMAEEDKNTRIDNELLASSAINKKRDEDLTVLNQDYLAGKMSVEKYEAEKNRITEFYANESLKNYLSNLEIEIKAGGLTAGKEAEMLAKAAELKKQITDNQVKDRTDSEKMWDEEYKILLDDEWKAFEEVEKKKKDENKKNQQAAFDLASEAGNAIFEINNANIEAEISGLEKKRDAELKNADEYIKDEKKKKEAQTAINAKYDKQVAEEKTKQAKNDKLAALFQIAIGTAVGITNAKGNVILMALIAAIGLIQAGVVLAKPLPTFAKGTGGKYSTPSAFVAGEAGTEIIEKQTGEMMAVTRPTVFINAKGMRIYSNPEIQNLNRMMVNNQINFDTSELKEIHKGIDNMAKSLAGQKQYIMQNGKATGYTQGDYTRKYLERMIG